MKRLIVMLSSLGLSVTAMAMGGMEMGHEPAIHLVRVDQLEVAKDDTQRWEL